jgi:hypothetical protein
MSLLFAKEAADTVVSHALAGRLYLSRSGWILLSVPNSLVRGAFDALDETGVELPLKDGLLNAHITVMRPDEITSLGGADKISERGHLFHYTLGKLKTCEPHSWPEMSKVWMIEVHSPELEKLRKSYGLTAKPKNNEFEFHVTVAVRRKNVLRANDIKKAARALERLQLLCPAG